MASRFSIALLLFLIFLSPASASSILWSETTYQDVTDLSISADGSSVVAAAGIVHYFTRDGMLGWKQWSADYAGISADGQYIAGATYGTALLLDPKGKKLWDRDVDGAVSAFSFSISGAEVVTGSPTGYLYFIDNSGEYLGRNTTTERATFPGVNDVSTSAEGVYTAAISDQAVYLYNRTGARQWQELNSSLQNGRYVALAPNGRELAAADTYLLFYLHSGGETLWTYRPNSEITALAFAGDSNTLAVAAQDGRVHVLSRDGTVQGTYRARNRISDLALSQNGSRILASSWDGYLYLLAGDGMAISAVNFGEPVFYCAISTDGAWGAAATKGTVYYLSLAPETPSPTATMTTPVTTLTITPLTTTPAPTTPILPTTIPMTTPTTPATGMLMIETVGLFLLSLIVLFWRKRR
jgi:hypothetical protein